MNLPCIMLFGCNIQMRNFLLVFLVPITALLLASVCCGRGLWTPQCWARYLAVITGLALILWCLKKCWNGSKVRESK